MKTALFGEVSKEDAKYIAEIDQCIAEIHAIRREMKKDDGELRRLQIATRRNIEHIRANLYVEKAA
jgi:hypothetical protein